MRGPKPSAIGAHVETLGQEAALFAVRAKGADLGEVAADDDFVVAALVAFVGAAEVSVGSTSDQAATGASVGAVLWAVTFDLRVVGRKDPVAVLVAGLAFRIVQAWEEAARKTALSAGVDFTEVFAA